MSEYNNKRFFKLPNAALATIKKRDTSRVCTCEVLSKILEQLPSKDRRRGRTSQSASGEFNGQGTACISYLDPVA
jgi:hypothetical protein